MIQIINIAKKIDNILSDRDYIHKIIIESNFSVIVHYVHKTTGKSTQDFDKTARQNDLLAKFNSGAITLNDFTEQFKQIEELSTEDNNNMNIEDIIIHNLGIGKEDYRIEFRPYSQDEYEYADSYVAPIFQGDNPIVSMSRFRFNGLFDNNPEKISGDIPPVVTFYSYKGGMARTTTMMAYAVKKAQLGKKVFIIDCDLEAPGYINFFDLPEHKDLKQGIVNGLVEMISDISFSKSFTSSSFKYSNYFLNTFIGGDEDSKYSGILKNIFIMPAGNLNETEGGKFSENRDHYLEGLSRINLSNPQVISKIFTDLFQYLKSELHIDVILIDSRTGFSDIIFNSIKYFTNHIVAFFGSNDQSIPGLLNLLDEYYNDVNSFGLTLVNAILPSNKDAMIWEKDFKQILSDYKNTRLPQDQEKDDPNDCQLHRDSELEKIGIKNGGYDCTKFIKYVLDDVNKDYTQLFKFDVDIFGTDTDIMAKDETANNTTSEDVTDIVNTNTLDSVDVTYLNSLKTINLKNIILQNLKRTLAKIKSFAEATDMDEKLFFYRDCMNDLFKQDKFLIKGYKGTGKTYLYQALERRNIMKNLRDRASKEFNDKTIKECDYITVQVIDTDKATIKKKFFEFENFITPQNLTTYNFQRFWRLHTWNSILLDPKFSSIREQSRFKHLIKDIFGDISITLYKECLQNDDLDLFVAIDEDMIKVNEQLRNQNTKMFLLYDQLDSRINPMYWEYAVSPLINYWKNYHTSYSNIMPKIFVRTDLMRRIKGTNTDRMEENFIEIEWTINEIFNYFIKLTLVDDIARNCLKIFMFDRGKKKYNPNKSTFFPSDRKLKENHYQLDNNEESSLTPFVNAFFGTKVVIGDRYLGNAYKYFQDNLCNADRTISLRPFINTLDDNAILAELDPRNSNKPITAIISSESYAKKEVRDRATRKYFDDLTRDQFSADLVKFREFLDYKDGDPYRFKSLTQNLYEELLEEVCKKYHQELIVVKNPSDLNSMLEANGIIAEKITREGKFYQFAPLYYYIWALKNSRFDELEQKRVSRIGKYVSGTLASGQPANFVITFDKRYLVKNDTNTFKENQYVQFDLRTEPNWFSKNTPYTYATNLKPYIDDDIIDG